jgi:hypothetical protein
MLNDVGHFCWSEVFGGETVAPGELLLVIFLFYDAIGGININNKSIHVRID